MFSKFFKNFDIGILVCLLAVSAFGTTAIWSIRADLVRQQLIFFLFGFLLFFLFSQIDYRFFTHFRWPLYLFINSILLATLWLAPEIRGATRWFEIGGWHIQPSEISKPFLIIILAGFLSSSSSIGVKKLFLSLVLIFPPVFLIFCQPDLGNAIVLLLIFAAILGIGGLRWFLAVGGLILGLGVIPLLWRFLKDYQKDRIISFLNPQGDPLGASYNLIQAMVTVGSGQFFGRGLGRGTQSHLRFLPEQHTDFIFASLAEELGFLGSAILVALYIFILWRILVVARNSKNPFGVLVLTGIFTMFLVQVGMNIGMNVGLLPVTGITLPLMSYGGSSIISAMIALGIVESVAREKKQEEALEIK